MVTLTFNEMDNTEICNFQQTFHYRPTAKTSNSYNYYNIICKLL